MENKICERVADLLSEYIDGGLDAKDAEFVRAHIENCAECRKAYGELLALEKLFDEAAEEVPEGFLSSVMERVAKEKQIADRKKKHPFVFSRKVGGFAIAAAVMLTVVASPLITSVLKNDVGGETDMEYVSSPEMAADDYWAGDKASPAEKNDGLYNAEAEVSFDSVKDVVENVEEEPKYGVDFGKYYTANMSDGRVGRVLLEDRGNATLEIDGESGSYSYEIMGGEIVLSDENGKLNFYLSYGDGISFNQVDG